MRIRFASHGIELEKGLLWLDATKPKPVAVVSHAHGDHMAKHERILCTPETGALMRRRLGTDSEFLEMPYGKTTRVGDLEISLHSAGHILGSASVTLTFGNVKARVTSASILSTGKRLRVTQRLRPSHDHPEAHRRVAHVVHAAVAIDAVTDWLANGTLLPAASRS